MVGAYANLNLPGKLKRALVLALATQDTQGHHKASYQKVVVIGPRLGKASSGLGLAQGSALRGHGPPPEQHKLLLFEAVLYKT